MMRDVLPRYGWIAVLLLAAAIHLSSFREGHIWGADYAWNWAQAVALVAGDPGTVAALGKYRQTYTSGVQLGPAVYPWGFPVLLALGHLGWGTDLQATKIFVFLFYLAGFVIFYFILRPRMAPLPATLLFSVAIFMPGLVTIKETIRPEAPFFLLLMASIYMMDRFLCRRRYVHSETLSLLILGLCIFSAYWMRTHGIILLPALVALQLYERQIRIWPYLVFAVGWALVKLFPGDTSYLGSGHLQGFVENPLPVLAANIDYLLVAPGHHFGQVPLSVRTLLGLIFFIFVVIGVVRRWREDRALFVVAFAYLAILLLYPFQATRFVTPILPILFYFAFQGIVSPHLRTAGLAVTACACFAVLAYKWSQDYPPIEGPYSAEAQALFRFVETTPTDAVFLFWKPRSLTFYAKRRAILRLDRPCPADFIVVYRHPDRLVLSPRNTTLHSFAAGQARLFQNAKFTVYRNGKACPDQR